MSPKESGLGRRGAVRKARRSDQGLRGEFHIRGMSAISRTIQRGERDVPERKAPTGADSGRPWHGWQPHLFRLRFKDLQKNGYVDYRSADPWPSPYDPPPVDMFFPGCMYGMDIHPVFQRSNWLGLNNNDYNLIAPALRLATCFLNDANVLTFFTGLLRQPPSRIWNAKAAIAKYGMLYQFDLVPVTIYHSQHAKTVRTLIDMSKCVTWEFDGNEIGTWATTVPLVHRIGLVPNSTSSRICMDMSFLNVLKGVIRVEHFPKGDKADPFAANLRTVFLLASNLMHELCHAVGMSCLDFVERSKQEPFFRDQRIAELGHAWETAVFGYSPHPSGANSVLSPHIHTCSAPYGLFGFNFPGARAGKEYMAALATSTYWGQKTYEFPFKTAEICKFFTRQFWDGEVKRNGIHAMRLNTTLAFLSPANVPTPLDPHETGPIVPRGPQYDESTDLDFKAAGFDLVMPPRQYNDLDWLESDSDAMTDIAMNDDPMDLDDNNSIQSDISMGIDQGTDVECVDPFPKQRPRIARYYDRPQRRRSRNLFPGSRGINKSRSNSIQSDMPVGHNRGANHQGSNTGHADPSFVQQTGITRYRGRTPRPTPKNPYLVPRDINRSHAPSGRAPELPYLTGFGLSTPADDERRKKYADNQLGVGSLLDELRRLN